MMEAVYNAAGLGLPIVMTLANRAIGAPINIWNDHSDAMAVRDSGWIQLFAETNQEAADLHVQAFRLAESSRSPSWSAWTASSSPMPSKASICPSKPDVDAFLPAYEPRQVLDPDDPISIGAMVGPEAFAEVRYLSHLRQLDALESIPALASEFGAAFGRESGGLVHTYRTDDAETVVVALGSVLGTIKDAVDRRRNAGDRVGVARHHDVPTLPPRRGAPGALRSSYGHRRREGVQRRLRRRALDRRRDGDARSRSSRFELWSLVSAGGRSRTGHSKRCLPTPRAIVSKPVTFLDLDQRDRRRVSAPG